MKSTPLPRRAVLVANTGWYLYNFRRPLAQFLRKKGYEVLFVSPADDYTPLLQKEGFRWIPWTLSRKGTNPLLEVVSLLRLMEIYRREKPDVVHHFTVKCVVYGTIAATISRIPATINAVTGLGHLYLDRSLRVRAIRRGVEILYRLISRTKRIRMIFQNPDDMKTLKFFEDGSVNRALLIRGSGVNVERFNPRRNMTQATPCVLFAGRLIREKGIIEFLKATEIVKNSGARVHFLVAGLPDEGNPSSLTASEIKHWRAQGNVEFLGHVNQLEEVIAGVDIVALPSYREGTPRVLLEAAAMEKALIATDVPGCRELVEHRVNGLLIPPQSAQALAEAIQTLIKSPSLCLKMGARGRAKVLQEFEESKVLEQTFAAYPSFESEVA
jgi:glycosyltransferase involved in cell wall biosynthesis